MVGTLNGEWDVFISHASEDKDDFVRPLAEGLEQRGLRMWFDESTLRVGDSLRRSIDRGLAQSRFGIVVLSPYFFDKQWPQDELDGLTAREQDGVKVILPVWHNITREQVQEFSPILAGRLAARSEQGLERVIEDLMQELQRVLEVEEVATPAEQDEAKGQLAPPWPGVRRYRVKRDFDEIDRADFREAAFDVIRDYFERTVAEIDTIEELRGRFVSLSAASFTCTIASTCVSNEPMPVNDSISLAH